MIEIDHEQKVHEYHASELNDEFSGREELIRKAEDSLNLCKPKSGLVNLHGTPGSGKSSLMVCLYYL